MGRLKMILQKIVCPFIKVISFIIIPLSEKIAEGILYINKQFKIGTKIQQIINICENK